MNNASWWVMAIALVTYTMMRHPILILVVPVSLVVFWDFGLLGLGILWPFLLAITMSRQAG